MSWCYYIPDEVCVVWPGPGIGADEDDGEQVEDEGEYHEGPVQLEPQVLTQHLPPLQTMITIREFFSLGGSRSLWPARLLHNRDSRFPQIMGAVAFEDSKFCDIWSRLSLISVQRPPKQQ